MSPNTVCTHVNDKSGINSLNTIFQLVNIALDKIKLYSKTVRQLPPKTMYGKNDLSCPIEDPLDSVYSAEDVWSFLEFLNMVFYIFKDKYATKKNRKAAKYDEDGDVDGDGDGDAASSAYGRSSHAIIIKQFIDSDAPNGGISLFKVAKGVGGTTNIVDIKNVVADDILPGFSHVADKTYSLCGHCDFVDELCHKSATAYKCAHGDFYFPQFSSTTASSLAGTSIPPSPDDPMAVLSCLDANERVSDDLFAFLRFIYFLLTHDDGAKLFLHLLSIHYDFRNSMATSCYRNESAASIQKRRDIIRLNVDNFCDTLLSLNRIGKVFEPYCNQKEKILYICLSTWRAPLVDVNSEPVKTFLKLFDNVSSTSRQIDLEQIDRWTNGQKQTKIDGQMYI